MKKITRVLAVIGTRPEAVKMAPVIKCISTTAGIQVVTCATAQHREMLDQVFDLFDIVPDVDLDLMRPNQSLSQITAAIFSNLDPVLHDVRPDWIIAQGDTTTVMATALLSYYHHIKFGHIEAGLRTGDKFQPFPEEINRKVASVTADLHFAPTEMAKHNLLMENIPDSHIKVTGNPVIDALQQVSKLPIPSETKQLLTKLTNKKIILVTAHRRENFGKPLANICLALKTIAKQYQDQIHIIYPVHLNPNVQDTVREFLSSETNITLLPPLNYLPMVHLMRHSNLVLTDSGGLQEEAPAFGVPVLVMRSATERPEGIAAGTVKLVGTEIENIVDETKKLLENPAEYGKMAQAINPYGDGRASERIVKAILNYENSGA